MTSPLQATANRIDSLFQRCTKENRAALVLYITSGFPERAITERLLPVLAESGCDLIELGIPFSDPIADGPTIQRASTIALEKGMSLDGSLEILRAFRQKHETPVIPFGAYNPFFVRGVEKAAADARAAGADGILCADLPLEEMQEFRAALLPHGLHSISLIAPTTPTERIRAIAEKSSGFLYCIAIKGTTGARDQVAADAREYLARIRSVTPLPLALGFGISRPEHVRAAVDAGADGVVVGSALINCIEHAVNSGQDMETAVGNYVSSLAAELHRK